VAAYEQDLEANLRDLCTRVHTGRYRPQPVRRNAGKNVVEATSGQRQCSNELIASRRWPRQLYLAFTGV